MEHLALFALELLDRMDWHLGKSMNVVDKLKPEEDKETLGVDKAKQATDKLDLSMDRMSKDLKNKADQLMDKADTLSLGHLLVEDNQMEDKPDQLAVLLVDSQDILTGYKLHLNSDMMDIQTCSVSN